MNARSKQPATEIGFPVTLAVTAIACLVTLQACGVNTGLHVATATIALVFCSRSRTPSALELLWTLYQTRTHCEC